MFIKRLEGMLRKAELVMNEHVSLTGKQLKLHTAKELLLLLRAVCADGVLADEEIELLRSWLERAEENAIPALPYLKALVDDILDDNQVSEIERRHLACAILNVMPEPYKSEARLTFGREARKEHEALCRCVKSDPCQPASSTQLELLNVLGISYPESCCCHEACRLIWEQVLSPLIHKQRFEESRAKPRL